MKWILLRWRKNNYDSNDEKPPSLTYNTLFIWNVSLRAQRHLQSSQTLGLYKVLYQKFNEYMPQDARQQHDIHAALFLLKNSDFFRDFSCFFHRCLHGVFTLRHNNMVIVCSLVYLVSQSNMNKFCIHLIKKRWDADLSVSV